MRAVRRVIDGVLMVTLIRPIVRLMVGRWRKRVQESPATAIGIQVQELLEAALIEELAPPASELQPSQLDVAEPAAGRSMFRLLLLVGVVITVTTASAYGVAELIKRRREAQAEEPELVAIPVEEGGATESIDTLQVTV